MAKKHKKLNVVEVRNGKEVKAQTLKFTLTDYDIIPVEPDDRGYSRARAMRETRRALETYYERGDDDDER